jgi:hypothetical protein
MDWAGRTEDQQMSVGSPMAKAHQKCAPKINKSRPNMERKAAIGWTRDTLDSQILDGSPRQRLIDSPIYPGVSTSRNLIGSASNPSKPWLSSEYPINP